MPAGACFGQAQNTIRKEHFMKRKGLLVLVLATLVVGCASAQRTGLGGLLDAIVKEVKDSNSNVSPQSTPTLDGTWRQNDIRNDNFVVEINGNNGTLITYNAAPGTLERSAIDKGFIKIGSTPYYKNITKTGERTWSAQGIQLNWGNGVRNVCTGITYSNFTITLSADGNTYSDGATWYRHQGNSNNTASVPAPVTNNSGMTFTTIAAFKTWLDSQPDNSNVNPYYVRVNISNLGSGSGSLGSVLKNKINENKYVDLDLSGSTFNSIPASAFNGCITLTNVIIPGRVTSIGGSAFSGCTSMESVTIGNNVTSIGSSAFQNCSSLTSVTIPASVQGFDNIAFGSGCISLNSVTFQGTIPSSGWANNNAYGTVFPGDLRAKFYATNKDNGTPGTYTKSGNTWTKIR
jgi:hypothetical protein